MTFQCTSPAQAWWPQSCCWAGTGTRAAAKIINILAEEAEVVAAWMVPRMRGVRRSGKYFKYALFPQAQVWVHQRSGSLSQGLG